MQYAFGSGSLYARRTGVTNPTPVRFGGLQGVTIDIAHSIKELYGSYQYPIAIARGTAKITGKSQFAQLDAQQFNDIFFGETTTATGQTLTAPDEVQAVASNQATVTHNGANVFVQDLGVVDLANGYAMTRSSGVTSADKYTVNETTGVYNFNSAMNGANVSISYQYADTANGSKVTITNKLLGSSPQFLVVLTETFQSKAINMTLNACMSNQMSLGFKLEDFMIPDFSFNAFADSNGNIGTISLAE